MSLSKGATQITGPFQGNGLEICRDLDGLMRRLELARSPVVIGIDHADGPDSTGYMCARHGVINGPVCEQCRQESESAL